jgi:hypothetical protein
MYATCVLGEHGRKRRGLDNTLSAAGSGSSIWAASIAFQLAIHGARSSCAVSSSE